MIEIDGAYGEGGGQLVRTAVALSAITGQAIRLNNVRAKRDNAGLAPQHLAAVRAVAEIAGAKAEGLELRATSFTFSPGNLRGGTFRFDVGTAGSVTLVMQALLPPLLAAGAGARVTIAGGTDVRQAPPVDYLKEVILRHLGRMGAAVRLAIVRRGYYPRGGGEITAEISPASLRPLELSTPGALRRLKGLAHVAKLPASIAERMRDAALAQLGAAASPGSIASRLLGATEAIGTGGAIAAWAEMEHTVLGAARVAERGVRAEALGEAVGRDLCADLAAGACADAHATDQLLVYLAMAGGRSTFTTRTVSTHAQTAMWLIRQFLPVRFATQPQGALYRVHVER